MLICVNLTAHMGENTAPTLARRKGAEIHEIAKSCNIRILAGQPLPGNADWGHLACDIHFSSREHVFSFIEYLHAPTVTLQPYDLDVFLARESPQIASMVQANFATFAPQLTDIPPDEVVSTLQEITLKCMAYQPEEVLKPEFDQWRTGERPDIDDEAWLELDQQQKAREAEELRAATADPYWVG